MKFEQAIYTSCRTGIDKDTSGFQLYSYSVKMKEIMDGEDLGHFFVYEQPDQGVPLEPNKDELETCFPKKVGFLALKRGYALCANRYVGKDYPVNSTRYGNIFCHVLTTEDKLPVYPIQIYGNSAFREGLSIEEANRENRPDYLPVIDGLSFDGPITREGVKAFLTEGNNMDVFANMLSCLLEMDSQKKLFICDQKENIPYWFAALQMSVPIKNAHDLSFVTYDYSPMQSPFRLVGCIANGTEYGEHLVHEYDGYIHVFDRIRNQNTSVPMQQQVGHFLVSSMRGNWSEMQEFHNFLNMFTYDKVDNGLHHAFSLFNYVKGEVLSLEVLEDGLAFMKHHGDKKAHEAVALAILGDLLKATKKDMKVVNIVLSYFVSFEEIYKLLTTQINERVKKLYINSIKDLSKKGARRQSSFYFEYMAHNNLLFNLFEKEYKLIVSNVGDDPNSMFYLLSDINAYMMMYPAKCDAVEKNESIRYVIFGVSKRLDELGLLKSHYRLIIDSFKDCLVRYASVITVLTSELTDGELVENLWLCLAGEIRNSNVAYSIEAYERLYELDHSEKIVEIMLKVFGWDHSLIKLFDICMGLLKKRTMAMNDILMIYNNVLRRENISFEELVWLYEYLVKYGLEGVISKKHRLLLIENMSLTGSLDKELAFNLLQWVYQNKICVKNQDFLLCYLRIVFEENGRALKKSKGLFVLNIKDEKGSEFQAYFKALLDAAIPVMIKSKDFELLESFLILSEKQQKKLVQSMLSQILEDSKKKREYRILLDYLVFLGGGLYGYYNEIQLAIRSNKVRIKDIVKTYEKNKRKYASLDGFMVKLARKDKKGKFSIIEWLKSI